MVAASAANVVQAGTKEFTSKVVYFIAYVWIEVSIFYVDN